MTRKERGEMSGSARTPKDYLKEPYARVLTPDEEVGGYTAEILEFPGCVTEGDTADEALRNLEEAAEGWIEAALNMGQEIPEPSDPQGYGGRIALRLPRSLHRRAMQMAERDGTSLNQFLVAAIAERVGAGTLYAQMAQRLEERAAQAAMSSWQAVVTTPMSGEAQTWRDLYWLVRGTAAAPVRTGFAFAETLDVAETAGRPLVIHGPEEES
jgi:predicted RNase H-like HicB family nuclease